MENSITEIIFGFFNNIMGMANQLKGFLFSDITIGTRTFQVWGLIAGGLFVTLLISWLIGKVIGWGPLS